MRMHFGEVLNIGDLGNHSVATVVELGLLLATAVNVTPDPKRQHFCEVEDGRTVYYICVPPANGTIFLIAVWPKAAAPQAELQVAASVWS
jgi:hypothetical protein